MIPRYIDAVLEGGLAPNQHAKATVKALRSPDVSERMSQIGFDVVASSPEEFGRFMREEVNRWARVVQKGGIKPD
jgi:tripartite-type tricarboxylate transporter receptor subunit TctC